MYHLDSYGIIHYTNNGITKRSLRENQWMNYWKEYKINMK